MRWLNRLLDQLSEFLAHRKGLLIILGIFMVLANFVFQFIPSSGWVESSDLLLHLGVILAFLGILLAWAL